MKVLRDYQRWAIYGGNGHPGILAALKCHKSALVVLPTGTGKTVVIANIAKNWTMGNVLLLAHRIELVDQMAATLGIELGYDPIIEQGVRGVDPMTLWQGGLIVCGSIQSMIGRNRMRKYEAKPFGLVIVDECVTGDTLVDTEIGKIRIDKLGISGQRSAMTYNNGEICYQPISAFMPKGNRPILRIETVSGKVIRCTKEHLLMTQSGWMRADQVESGVPLFCADVDAAPSLKKTNGEDSADSFSAIKSLDEPMRIGWKYGKKSFETRHCAGADAGPESDQGQGHLNVSRECTKATEAIPILSGDMTIARQLGTSSFRKSNAKRSLEHCLVILVSASLTKPVRHQGFLSTTVARSKNGLSIRQSSCQDFCRQSELLRAEDTEQQRYRCQQNAVRHCEKSMNQSSSMGASRLRKTGWTKSEKLGSPGGFAMTAPHLETGLSSTQKDTKKKKFVLLPNGSENTTGQQAYTATATSILFSALSVLPDGQFSKSSKNSYLNVCNTNFDPVVSVRDDGMEEVFDITVEETHCFFGNGILVHNCHRSTSPSYTKLIDRYQQLDPECRVLGVTATPNRTDGTALGLVFESVAYEMAIIDGIDQGWLCDIHQKFCTLGEIDFSALRMTKNEFGEADFKREDLEQVLSEEKVLHEMSDPLLDLTQHGEQAIIFAASVAHAHLWAKVLNRSRNDCAKAVDGTTDKVERHETVLAYREGKLQFLLNFDCFSEGFDAPSTSMIVMGRPTKSLLKYMQMLGRGTRPVSGCVDGIETPEGRKDSIAASAKPYLTVLDFVGNSRHKIVTSSDVLGGNYDIDIRNAANELLGAKPGNVQNAINKARAIAAFEAEQRRRQEIKFRGTGYELGDVNPFDAAPVGATMEKIRGSCTDGQVSFLVNLGIDRGTALKFSKKQAGAIISDLKEKRCTLRQANILRQYGYDPENFNVDSASAQIDEIKANGWKKS